MRKFLHKILFIANIIVAIALLFSYLAPIVNPSVFILPAFFGLAYPYLLVLNIFFIILWASFIKWEIIISIVAILAGFSHFTNFVRFKKKDNSAEGTFKVLSYNVRLFNAYEKNNNDTESKILDYIKEQGADIVCLQEMFSNNERGVEGNRVLSSTGNRYYSHTKFIGSDNKRFYGIGTYSKYKIVNRGDIYHPNSSSLTIFSDIVIDQDTFRIFNNHLQSFKLKNMERSFIEEVMSLDERESRNEVKELSSSLRNGFLRRSAQADIVKEAVNNSPYPVIVLGDFNDTPISYTYHKLRKGLNDSFVESGYGAGFTYKGVYPTNRIDFILFSDKLDCKYFEVLKVKYSDHYPVFSNFTITE